MKLLTWNIRHGGSKPRMESIIKTVSSHDADVVVLTEFRLPKGEAIMSTIRDYGYLYQVDSNPPINQNGILIASKQPISKVSTINSCQAIHRWLEVRLENPQITILGLHIPGSTDKWGKPEFWNAVLDYASRKRSDPTIIVGDFNTGLLEDAEGAPFVCSECMIALRDQGWVDAWRVIHGRHREYTWFSNAGNGFRLDYAFLSPVTKGRLQDACHSHEERKKGYSDHSALILTLS